MKNIFIIDDDLSSKKNGIGTYIRELSEIFLLNDCTLWVISSNCEVDEFTIVDNVRINRMYFPRYTTSIFVYPQVLIYFLRLYISDSSDNLFVVNHIPCGKFLILLRKYFPGSNIFFVFHDMSWTDRLLGNVEALKETLSKRNDSALLETRNAIMVGIAQEKEICRMVDRIICLSEDTVNLLQSVYEIESDKICLIPNGLRDSYIPLSVSQKMLIRKKMNIPIDEKIVLYTGRVNQIKGIFNLIHAFTKLLLSYSNIRLVIVGAIYDVESVLQCSNTIASKVTYTGHISQEEVKAWYQIADIGVLLSYYEQCSYTGIEMMMHGLPIVASDGFCVRNMFHHNENSLVAKLDFQNMNIYEENISKCLLQLLYYPSLCNSIGEKSRLTYLSKYSFENMLNRYKSIL